MHYSGDCAISHTINARVYLLQPVRYMYLSSHDWGQGERTLPSGPERHKVPGGLEVQKSVVDLHIHDYASLR